MRYRLILLTLILAVASCGKEYPTPAPAPPPPPLPPEQEKPGNGDQGEEDVPEIPFKDVILYGEFREDFSESASFLRFAPKSNGGEDFRYYSGHPSLSAANTKVMMMRIDPEDGEGWGKGPQVLTKDYTFYGSYSARMRVPDIKKAQKNLGAAAGVYVYDVDDKYGHSEIDFELRVADPTIVYLSAITGTGKELNRISRTINLAKGTIIESSDKDSPATITAISDFDASKKFYIYGFDWTPEKITWWIRKDENTDRIVLWEYIGKELFAGSYAPSGIPVLPAHYTTSFWHSTSRLAQGMASAKEAPKYPFEMEIDWMAYEPFDDQINEWKENASK